MANRATPGELATHYTPDPLEEEDAELRRQERFDTKRCAQGARLLQKKEVQGTRTSGEGAVRWPKCRAKEPGPEGSREGRFTAREGAVEGVGNPQEPGLLFATFLPVNTVRSSKRGLFLFDLQFSK